MFKTLLGSQLTSIPIWFDKDKTGDQTLLSPLCGSAHAHRLLDATISNEYTLRYLITGKDEPRGWVMTWLLRKMPGLA